VVHPPDDGGELGIRELLGGILAYAVEEGSVDAVGKARGCGDLGELVEDVLDRGVVPGGGSAADVGRADAAVVPAGVRDVPPRLLHQSVLIGEHGPLLPVCLDHLKHAVVVLLLKLQLD